MRYKFITGFLLVVLLILSGCSPRVTGHATAELKNDMIRNGETTILTVNGQNTGDLVADVVLKIVAEDPNKVIISYPGSLEDTLQPNEDIGNKVVNVQGFTDYSVTKYWIKVKLVNKVDGKVLDEKIEWLTVKK